MAGGHAWQGEGACVVGVSMAGGCPWWGHAWWSGVVVCMAGGVCMVGCGAWVCMVGGGGGGCMAGDMATAADGTHPTGMHSCSTGFLNKT